MSAAEQLQQLGHDKVLEARMAEMIGTTKKALQRQREDGKIPRGVWDVLNGRVTYSIRRYDEWVERGIRKRLLIRPFP